jgi:hypothetical protein
MGVCRDGSRRRVGIPARKNTLRPQQPPICNSCGENASAWRLCKLCTALSCAADAVPRAGVSLLTQVSFTDRDGAGCIEKELLALFGYALTGSSPFDLGHMGLRIPVR